MKHPYECKSIRLTSENEKNIAGRMEFNVCIDLAEVVEFDEVTFNDDNLTKGTWVAFGKYGINIITTYNEFKEVMKVAGLFPEK